jgi:cholesterol transport system auxiliary component
MTQTIILPRRALLIGGAAFALAGCSDLIGPSNAPVQLYGLRPPGGATGAGPRVPWHLSVGAPSAFENSGRIDGVAAESDGFKADYILQTDLRDFEARYDQPNGVPTAVVRIEAKIAPTIGRTIVSSLKAAHEAQATQNSVAAAVQAMDIALGQALTEIVNWALSQPPPKRR